MLYRELVAIAGDLVDGLKASEEEGAADLCSPPRL